MNLILSLTLLSNALISLQTTIPLTIAPVSPIFEPRQEILSEVDIFLSKLEICESNGTDVKVLDTNGKYSYSYFQFQEETFNHFGELYKLPHNDIYSRDQQYAIARKMIENGLWRHWYNCSKKIGNIPLSSP